MGILRANAVIPDGLRMFYFEIRVENEGEDGHVGIGLYPADQRLKGMPGWYNGSYGYHGDDGCKFTYRLEGHGESYGPTFTKDDVIGCGWNLKDGNVFFTKNGKNLGKTFTLDSLERNRFSQCMRCVLSSGWSQFARSFHSRQLWTNAISFRPQKVTSNL